MSFKDTFKSLIDPYAQDDKDGFVDEVETGDEGANHSVFTMLRSGRKSAPAERRSSPAVGKISPRQRLTRPQSRSAAKNGDVRVFRPTDSGAAKEIVDAMVNNETVVVNLENTPDEYRARIMNFVLGAAYARRDEIQSVSDRTFIITPSGRALTGDLLGDPMDDDRY